MHLTICPTFLLYSGFISDGQSPSGPACPAGSFLSKPYRECLCLSQGSDQRISHTLLSARQNSTNSRRQLMLSQVRRPWTRELKRAAYKNEYSM